MVFGQVLSGADVVKKIEQLPTDARSRPEVEVKVTNCGELVLLKKGKGEITVKEMGGIVVCRGLEKDVIVKMCMNLEIVCRSGILQKQTI